jgi:hypothetical protein
LSKQLKELNEGLKARFSQVSQDEAAVSDLQELICEEKLNLEICFSSGFPEKIPYDNILMP